MREAQQPLRWLVVGQQNMPQRGRDRLVLAAWPPRGRANRRRNRAMSGGDPRREPRSLSRLRKRAAETRLTSITSSSALSAVQLAV